MQSNVIVTSYGRPASEALARTIAEAKSGRALAPVTVVVPSNFAGLAARRILGSGALGLDGVANVNFFTPFRLAELLASGQIGDRRPLTNPVLGAAVRRALVDDPRQFLQVRDHQATEQALVAVVGELSNVGAQGLEAIESTPGHAASIVALYRSVKGHLRGFHDEADVARAATHRGDLAAAIAPFGHIVWHLPGPLAAPLATMMKAVLAVSSSTVIIGATGDEAADREPIRTSRIGGVAIAEGAFVQLHEPVADHVISLTDADEEVRAVVREVIQLVDQGVRPDRIGIFHPAPDPYVRILDQQLAAAEVPANGPSRRRLGQTIAGRVLLGAIGLPAERWRRDRVMALVTSGPLRNEAGPARPAAWESLSRDAGVVGGLGDWRAKLATHQHRLEQHRLDAVGAGRSGLVVHLDQQLTDLSELASFVATLAGLLDQVERAASWHARAVCALDLLRALLGAAHTHGSWPEDEQVAFERVEAALERLALLDEIEPNPSAPVFLRALSDELAIARDRTGRFGHGVVYGPLSSSVGLDLDAVFILGCTEGLCPTPRREDALLPDRARRLTRGDLPERLGQIDEQHRLFLAALAAAPAGRRWLLFPRGDLRSSRRSRPSRWLLPTAGHLAGRELYATDFEDMSPDGVHEVASHAAGLAQASHFTSIYERDLAEVYRYVLGSGDALSHPATGVVRPGLEAQRARRSSSFTKFDGNLSGQPIPSTEELPQSPSRLETWAACGFRYFLAYELGLADRDDPERTIELSALDRGSVMHSVLESFLSEVIEQGAPQPGDRWSNAQRNRARQIALDLFAQLEARGRTGRPILWATQKSDLLSLLDEFLTADDQHRAKTGVTPRWLEFAFGSGDQQPVTLEIGEQRTLRFRGIIDRVDEGPDGKMFVSDYKTGSGRAYSSLDKGDPTLQGTMLQLGLYAEAASQLLGADQVETHYWMVNTAANHARYGYRWTTEHRDRLIEVLTTIVAGIESGIFAAVPGEWQSFRSTYERCAYCDFDNVCPRDRAEQAAEKQGAPELAVRVALTSRAER